MGEFTEEEMAGLSDEERAALLDEDDDSTGADPEGDQDGEDGGDESGGEGDTSGTDEGGDSGEGDPSPGQPEAEGKAEAPPAIPFIPVLPVDTSRLDGISSQLEELNQQLQDGDLDLVEYTKLRDPLIREQTQIELTQHFNEQQQAQLWKHEQTLFFSKNDAFRTDPILNGALRAAFKQLDTDENEHKTGYDLLLEAKALVDARFGGGVSGGKASTGTSGKSGGDQTATPRRGSPARDSTDIPKTLADVIPASDNSTNADEFAHLDNLTGLEYEQALAKLPKDAEERYLRGA